MPDAIFVSPRSEPMGEIEKVLALA